MDKSETSLTIEVKVTPRAKKSALEKTGAGYRAWVQAAPDKANKELIKLMANYFSLPPSQIRIIRGEKSRSKLLIVEQRS